MDSLWIEAFRYHKWANGRLLEVCSDFDDDQLQLTAPGTYGTVAKTLQHMLSAEQRYVARLGGSPPRMNEHSEFPGIPTLKKHARCSAGDLIAIAERLQPDEEIITKFHDGHFRMQSGIVLLQALHHGNDHRTHVCTILGHHGLEYGGMDVWAYGDTTGAIVPVTDRPC